MVCLNEFIPFSKVYLRNNLISEMETLIDDELNSYIENYIICKIKCKIQKKLKNLFDTDSFIYKNMHENFCTHKFKRGKNEGFFCCKKIRTNIPNGKKDFLCATHSKLHISKKQKYSYKDLVGKTTEIVPEKKVKKRKKVIKIMLGNPSMLCFKSIFP